MMERTLRGKVAIAGIGESLYFKRGKSPIPEFKLALQAILAAAEDAGIEVRQIDGFASFADERSMPVRLAAALGLPELRFCNLAWDGGGGGGAAALGNAAAAVASGIATVSSSIARLPAVPFVEEPVWPEIRQSPVIESPGIRME